MSNQITVMADRLNIEPNEMQNIVISTIMPGKQSVTNEQFVSFLAVANEYKLNPLSKEIYAFPARGGGIQPIVSIDGWLKIINNHPQFDGMEFVDNVIDGQLFSVTCKLYRKDRKMATEVTEYMSECRRGTDTWKQYPARMLRHKATIQAARYAFGLSGIIDPDEAERFEDAGAIKNPAKEPEPKPTYSDDDIEKNCEAWELLIQSGKKTAKDIINSIESKYELSDDQKMVILGLEVIDVEYTEESA